MKRRKGVVRKDLAIKRMVKFYILIILILGWLGVSYAAYTDGLTAGFDVSFGNMNFVFDENHNKWCFDDMLLKQGSNTVLLTGNVYYEDKNMKIEDIMEINDISPQPLDAAYFMDGNASIMINYTIIPDDDSTIIKPSLKTVDAEEDEDLGYIIGPVQFGLLSDTPVWGLGDGNDVWSWGTQWRGGISTDVSTYLPDNLGEFEAYNKMEYKNNGEISGTITLQQTEETVMPGPQVIGLSDLVSIDATLDDTGTGLSWPGWPNQPDWEDCTLNVKANYGFSIPLNLDQFNAERDEE